MPTLVTVSSRRDQKFSTASPLFSKLAKIELASLSALLRQTFLEKITQVPSSMLAMLMISLLGRWQDTRHGASKVS